MKEVLKNEHIRLVINHKGAEMTSLTNLITQTEYLWQGDPAIWPWHAPNLFPVVGGQTNNQIMVDGQAYPMKRHGFARNSEFVNTECTPTYASFELRSSSVTKVMYPYDFIFEIIYELDGPDVIIEYKIRNTSDTNMFLSLGAHPAFNVPFAPGEDYTDYYIEFERDGSLETSLLGPDGLLSGEKGRVHLDERQLNLTPELFANDALVLLSLKSRKVSLCSRKNDHRITLEFGMFPYLGIWAKPGAPFVCIEPWLGVADTAGRPVPIEGKQGIHRVTPKTSFIAHYCLGVI